MVWEIVPQLYGAVTFVAQAPASGAVIAIELWAMTGEAPQFICGCDCEEYCEMDCCVMPIIGHAVVAKFDKMSWFFGGNAHPVSFSVNAYDRSTDTLGFLDDLLKENDFALDQILRTWIYQGHLVLEEGETQRYKELNRARTDVFGDTEFLKDYLPEGYEGTVYPASTGIGADDFDVVISAIALNTKRKDVIAVPLENPNQTSAFDYGEVYSPQSPKFSRAMAVAVDDTCLVFVSGTASITDSESRHIENPVKQTELTLDNIAALIDGENLVRHGIKGMTCSLANLECVRVYVKRPKELEAIRKVCERRLPDVPTLYTIADICRPELLVEIEGVAVAK
jgi:enamine deaminase RidA (YjgF/YER057c/UK114 family)